MPEETSHEIEVKLRVDNATALSYVPEVFKKIGVTVDQPTLENVRDEYLDTGDWLLHRAGLACRLRSTRGRTVVNLKTRATGKKRHIQAP